MYRRMKEKVRSWLIGSQRHTQTDMLYLARGGFWISSATIASSATSFFLALAFANLMAPEAYGSYKYLLSLAGLLGALTLSGLGEAISQAAAQGHDGALENGFRRSRRWNALATVAGLAIAGHYFIQGNRTFGAAMIAIALSMPLTRSADLYAAFLKGKAAFAEAARWAIFRTVAPAAATFAALLLNKDLAVLVAVAMLANAAAAFYAYRRTVARYRPAAATDGGSMAFGLHLSFVNVLSSAVAYADKILIFQILGPVPTAVYAFAQALPEQIDALVSGNLRTLALPKFADHVLAPKETGPLLRKAAIVMLLTLPIIGLYALAAPFLFRLFFPAYEAAVPYSQLLAVALLAIAPSQLFAAFLAAHKAVKERYAIGLAPSLVWLGLMLVLMQPYGLYGLAIAKIAAKAFGLVLSGFLCVRLAGRATPAPASP